MQNHENKLGERILASCTFHCLSRRELARRIGKSPAWVGKVIKGHETPGAATLRLMAGQLAWTPTELDAAFGEMGQASDDVIAMIAARPDLNAMVRRAFLHGGLIQDSQRRDLIGTRSPRA